MKQPTCTRGFVAMLRPLLVVRARMCVAVVTLALVAWWEAAPGVVSAQREVFEAIAKGDEQTVTALLDRGLPVTTTNEQRYSLVHWAAITRQTRIAALLVTRGAPVNTTGPGGRTPLHDAALSGDAGLVRLFVDSGARVYAADQLGKMPLDVAIEQGSRALFPLLKPLHVAAEQGEVERVRGLVHAEPASVQARDESGATALHVAARAGRREIAAMLLESGADINARGACGETPLRVALERGRQETSAFLQSKNAEDQSDDLLLRRSLPAGEAIIWYLFDVGWVVRTSAHVLVFDYVPARRNMVLPPTVRPCLGSGEMDPVQLRNQNVVVFASFLRDENHRDVIFSWRKIIPRITYVIGDETAGDAAAVHIPPRAERRVGDLQVLTIPTTGYGEGFIVTVDGLTIFYGGDLQSSEDFWPAFTREIDYIRKRVTRIHVAFLQMMFEEQISSSKGVLYALQTLRPAAMFPNSAVAGKRFFPGFVQAVTDARLPTVVRSARHRGDVFFHPTPPTPAPTPASAPWLVRGGEASGRAGNWQPNIRRGPRGSRRNT